MNLLFIAPYVPNLIRVRPFNLIRYLKKRGHRLTLLCISSRDDSASLNALRVLVDEVHAFTLPGWKSWVNCGLALPTSQPLQAAYTWNTQLANELRARLAQQPYDLVHVEHLRGVRYALLARATNPRIPVIWDSVDSITHLFRQTRHQHPNRLARLLINFELARTQAYEKWLAKQFDRLLVTSQIDRETYLRLEPRAAVEVLTNGVDIDYFRPNPAIEREDDTILVSGKMSYHANVSMALYMIEEIMPHVWAQRPMAKLAIVGKDPPERIRKASPDGRIVVTGTVPEVLPWLQKATVSVAPLTYGAGVQNKVLEAMACATPVVASPLAVSAIQAVHGSDVLVADHPHDFAKCILSLLHNKDQQRALGENGRKYVERHHSWEQIAGQLENIYQTAMHEQKG